MISGIGNGGFSPRHSVANMQAEMSAKFKEFDADGDGALSKIEMLAGASQDGQPIEGAKAIFDLIDTDRDGIVTQTEHDVGLEALTKNAGHGHPPGPPPSQSAAKSDFDLTTLLLQSLLSQENGSDSSDSIASILSQLGRSA